MEYTYDEGEFILSNNGIELSRSKNISIVFTANQDMWTLLKHGKTELVEKWYDSIKKQYRELGVDDFANELILLTGKFPVDELNKCIQITGYVKKMYKKFVTPA